MRAMRRSKTPDWDIEEFPFPLKFQQVDAPDHNYALLRSICVLTPPSMDSLGGGRYRLDDVETLTQLFR